MNVLLHSLPRPFDNCVALYSVMSGHNQPRMKSCNVTAAKEFKPEDTELEKKNMAGTS